VRKSELGLGFHVIGRFFDNYEENHNVDSGRDFSRLFPTYRFERQLSPRQIGPTSDNILRGFQERAEGSLAFDRLLLLLAGRLEMDPVASMLTTRV
jgi:hypothetical protein